MCQSVIVLVVVVVSPSFFVGSGCRKAFLLYYYSFFNVVLSFSCASIYLALFVVQFAHRNVVAIVVFVFLLCFPFVYVMDFCCCSVLIECEF